MEWVPRWKIRLDSVALIVLIGYAVESVLPTAWEQESRKDYRQRNGMILVPKKQVAGKKL